MIRSLFFTILSILISALPLCAERWVRADLQSKSYRIDLDDRDLIGHLALRSALPAQVPDWLLPSGNAGDPVSVSTTTPFTADFRVNSVVEDVASELRRRLIEHGYAVTIITTDEPRVTGDHAVQSVAILLQPEGAATSVHILYAHHPPRDSGEIYLEAEAYDLSLKGLVVHDRGSGCEFLIADHVLDRFNRPTAVKLSAAQSPR